MKSHIILITSVLLALTSCGTTASFTQATGQQKYQDGIYYRPQSLSLDAQAAQLTETDDLIARTKSSAVFVKTIGKVDTLFIPDNMSATFKFNHRDSTTTVSLYDDNDLWFGMNWGFTPWYGFHNWYSPFWRPGYWRTWSLGWYDPFWYDPFWFDPFWGPSWSWGFGPFWADPFYYAGYWGGWYDPFFPYIGPYYIGGGSWHSSRHIIDREIATRGPGAGMARQSVAGVGRLVRTGTASASGARSVTSGSTSKSSSVSRVASASRSISSASRSAGSTGVSRSAGASRSSASSYTGSVSRAATPNTSRSNSSSYGSTTYRRSASSSSTSSSSYRASGNVSRSGSTSSPSSSYSPSRSSGSSYSPSRSAGGSFSSGASHSAGGYSGGGGGVSRGGGGRR